MSVPSQEIIDAIIEKTGLGVSEALLAGKVLMDAAEAYTEHGGDKIPTSIKIFRGGLWETVNIPLNIAQGDVTSLAITKAIVGAATGVGIAALAASATAGLPFIIGFGAAFAFGVYAGQKISEAVESGYDTIIGPDFEYDKDLKIITVNYALSDALKANAGWYYAESFKGILLETGLTDWTLKSLHSQKGGKITYQDNIIEFVNQSFDNLKKDGSDLESVVLKILPYKDFSLQITGGAKYNITNLGRKTESQIASLAKSDTDVLQALVQMKSYAIDDHIRVRR